MCTRWAIVAILVVSAAVRLAWIALVPNAQYSDSVWYDGAAANLAANGVYGLEAPSAWFPPGYPFFLMVIYKLVGHQELAGKLGNVAISLGLTGFTYLLGRIVAGEVAARTAALLTALWPNLVFHTGILSSDLLAGCGFAAAMWLAMRSSQNRIQAVVLGLLVGWMVLVRPVSVILLAAIGLSWWRSQRSLTRAVARLVPVCALAALVVGGWTVRNYREFGEPIAIATNGGYNFWQTNHAYADGNDTFWPNVPMDDPEYVTMRYGDEFTKNREGYRYALAYLREHPTHPLTMLPTKLFWLWHTDTSGLYEGAIYAPMEAPSPLQNWMDEHQRLVEAATFRYYEVLMVLGIVGASIAAFKFQPCAAWPLIALPLLLTFFHVFFHAKDRFHIPLDGMIAIFAAVAVSEAARAAWRLRTAQRRLAEAPRGWSA